MVVLCGERLRPSRDSSRVALFARRSSGRVGVFAGGRVILVSRRVSHHLLVRRPPRMGVSRRSLGVSLVAVPSRGCESLACRRGNRVRGRKMICESRDGCWKRPACRRAFGSSQIRGPRDGQPACAIPIAEVSRRRPSLSVCCDRSTMSQIVHSDWTKIRLFFFFLPQ